MFDYSVIFENSVDPMLVLERGSIVHYNKAAVHLFGLKHGQQLERKKLSKLFSQSPRSGISNSRIIKEACEQTQLLGSKKLVLNVDLNGNNLCLDTTFTAFKDTEGNQMNHVVMKDLSSLLEKANYPQYLKEIENKLLNAQEKLVDALKLARLTTWELWVKDDKMVLDQQFCQAIGLNYDPQKEPVQGLAYVNKYLIESDRPLVLQAYQEAIDTLDENYKSLIEYRIKVDQNVYTILATVRVVKDQHGKTVKVYGTGQDVSDVRRNEKELEKYRKELEYLVQTRTQELKTSEEKLTDALELASLGTWEFDFATGNFTLSENFFKEIKDGFDLGPANQFSYARFLEIVHPDDKQLFLDFTNKALQAEDENFLDYLEYRIISKRGGIRNIYISLKVEKGQDGRNIKHYGTLQNITNIRNTEAEMKRLTAIIENTSDNVCVITPDKKLVYLNGAGRDFYGFTQDEKITGKPLRSIQSEYSLEVIDNEALPAATTHGIWSGENKILNGMGELIPVSQVLISHYGPDGKVEYFSSIIRDISKLKKIEQDLKLKNNELDTFVYSAGHDLKGPIASLIGLYNIVQYEITDKPSLQYFKMYHEQIQRLKEIIVNFMELTKIKEKQAEYAEINFNAIVNDTIKSFSHLPNFQDMDFRINIQVNRRFNSDKGLVRTILQNLIDNGIKYSRPEINSYLEIDITDENENGGINIKVEDNGVGIDPEIQDKVFHMFFRGHEKATGSGLGLYILNNAVEKLKGKINLRSVPLKGSTFDIALPRNH